MGVGLAAVIRPVGAVHRLAGEFVASDVMGQGVPAHAQGDRSGIQQRFTSTAEAHFTQANFGRIKRTVLYAGNGYLVTTAAREQITEPASTGWRLQQGIGENQRQSQQNQKGAQKFAQ